MHHDASLVFVILYDITLVCVCVLYDITLVCVCVLYDVTLVCVCVLYDITHVFVLLYDITQSRHTSGRIPKSCLCNAV